MLYYKCYPTKDNYDDVTCTIVQKYPFMKAPVGSPTVSYIILYSSHNEGIIDS